MDLKKYKQDLIEKLMATNEESVLRDVDRVLEYGRATWWDELTPAQRKHLEESHAQIKRGETIPAEEVFQKIDAILNRG